MDHVILVDERDRETGIMEKMEAHRKGMLHRAFSILIFNSKGEMLIQKRADGKYHSAGLWTNACCSHPRPNETVEKAAQRRLMEEMGFDSTLTFSHTFIYKATLDNSLTEHELDYVFTSEFNGSPNIDLSEVSDWKFIPMPDLKNMIQESPSSFTHWFKIILDNYLERNCG